MFVTPNPHRKNKDEISSELGLVYKNGKVRELLIHLADVDHEGSRKMVQHLEDVFLQKEYLVLAIDNYTKWPFAKLCKSCNSECRLEFVHENLGITIGVKLDNAKCFISSSFEKLLRQKGTKTQFVTPYSRTANSTARKISRHPSRLRRWQFICKKTKD